MSCTKKVESFQSVEVKIEFDKDCVKNIERTADLLLKQKLSKLNNLLKNLNVYSYNNILLVNDRYCTCKDFEDIAGSFGFTVQSVACSLKGKNYIVSDKLIELQMLINGQYELKGYANQALTKEVQQVIEQHLISIQQDEEFINIIRAIRETGDVLLQGKQRVVSIYYDDQLRSEERGEIVSNKEAITEKINNFIKTSTKLLESGNEQLRDGTAKLLYSRARQMGYAVKEERIGKQIQLVLVRSE